MGESAKCVWDDLKEASNIATHAYAFGGLDQVFDGRRIVTTEDKRRNYGEPRFNSLVEYDKRIINITFTPRHGKVRLISVRAASREEREAYLARTHTTKRPRDGTDWARIDAMSDADIERNAANDPENPASTADHWATAVIGLPPLKTHVHATFDEDVVAWFKAQGRGYQTRMNAVLRRYMETHRKA